MRGILCTVAGVARTGPSADSLEAQALALAGEGCSIEVIARTLGTSRYRAEQAVGPSPAGRADVPYRHRRLYDEADISARYEAGESAERIAHDVGVSVTAVFDVLHREGVELRGKAGPHVRSYADVLTLAYLRDQYVEARRGSWEIASEIGCSEATVRNWLRRHGLPVRPMKDRRRAYAFPDELLDAVAAGNVGLEAAAAEVGCSRTEFGRALARSGRALPYRRRPNLTRELLTRLYVDERLTCPAISRSTGWATGTVRARLREYGIPRRVGAPKHPAVSSVRR